MKAITKEELLFLRGCFRKETIFGRGQQEGKSAITDVISRLAVTEHPQELRNDLIEALTAVEVYVAKVRQHFGLSKF